jgi:hypothetical protein
MEKTLLGENMTQKQKMLLLMSEIIGGSVLRDRGNGIVEIEVDTIRIGDTNIGEIKETFEQLKKAVEDYQTLEEWADSFKGKEMREGGSKIRNYVGKGIIERWELGARGTGVHFQFKDETGELHSVWRPLPIKFRKNGSYEA